MPCVPGSDAGFSENCPGFPRFMYYRIDSRSTSIVKQLSTLGTPYNLRRPSLDRR
jgi:hypothetical protein